MLATYFNKHCLKKTIYIRKQKYISMKHGITVSYTYNFITGCYINE